MLQGPRRIAGGSSPAGAAIQCFSIAIKTLKCTSFRARAEHRKGYETARILGLVELAGQPPSMRLARTTAVDASRAAPL